MSALDHYALGKGYGPTMFSMHDIEKADEIRLAALRSLVAEQTQESLDEAAAEALAHREEAEADRAAKEKSPRS